MHRPEIHQGERLGPDPGAQPHEGPRPAPAAIWLLSGIGEGPHLASVLLARGWRLRVSVVSESAARAYPPHPAQELQVGALAGAGAIEAALRQARRQGGFRWVVDATHPFALQISADLQAACQRQNQPLLRLQRPALALVGPAEGAAAGATPAMGPIPGPVKPASQAVGRGLKVRLLASLEELSAVALAGSHLLLAIGARRLGQARAHSPGAIHFARILPTPAGLAQARAAGLADGRLACLHPRSAAMARGSDSPWTGTGTGSGPGAHQGLLPGAPRPGAIERALCRRWAIDAVLCRQSGGPTETLWSDLCAELGLELLVVRQPQAGPGAPGLELAALLAALGHPDGGPADPGRRL